MRVLQKKQEISEIWSAFRDSFQEHATHPLPASIGFQSGHYDTDVFWSPKHGIWGYFGLPPHEKSPGRRYWNVFGIGRPEGMVSIACEINPPIEGINRQAAGVFLRDSSSVISIAHRGIFTAYGRVRKDFVRTHFRGRWLAVRDDGRESAVILVAELGAIDFMDRLRDFIFEVQRIKQAWRKLRII